MSLPERDEEFEITAEERRALVILGLLAVFAGLSTTLPSTTFINFPANSPFIHITIYVVPFLETLTGYWVGYALCMYFYFSNDWFQRSVRWAVIRRLLHGLGQGFEGLYPLTVAYLVVFGEVSFFLPDFAQGVYWFFVIWGLFILSWSLGEAAFGMKGVLRRLMLEGLRSVAHLIREVGTAILEALEILRKKLGRLRKHTTTILLGFLAISSTGFGIARWEASQTFNGLTIYCTGSTIVRYPNASAPLQTYGEFVASIGFKNPNWFPIDLAWSATPLLNDTNYFSGFLQDVVPAFSSNHVAKMRFAFIPVALLSNSWILTKVISYERHSILGDVFAEPRVFFISSDQTIPLHPDSFMGVISNRVPLILWSIFIQHSNLLQSQSSPSC